MTIPSEKALIKSRYQQKTDVYVVTQATKLSETRMTIEFFDTQLTPYIFQNISIERFHKMFEIIG